MLRVSSAIALELMNAHDAGKTVNLNELRARLSKKSGYSGVPRLVDIISAVPEDYKKALLPKLKARPIRTASGVCVYPLQNEFLDVVNQSCWLDCRGCCYVQTA